MWPEEKENGDARFLPRPVLPFHDRAPKSPIFGLLAKEGTVLQFRNMKILTFSLRNTLINCYKHYLSLFLPLHNYTEKFILVIPIVEFHCLCFASLA